MSPEIRELKRQIAEQEAFVRSMIQKGFPSQAAEDSLRALKQRLLQLTQVPEGTSS